MSSRFSGGYPDFFHTNGVNGTNYNQQVNYRSPLLPLAGKRSLVEFQQQQQQQQQQQTLGFLRNVKPKAYNDQPSSLSSISNISSSSSQSHEMERKMMSRLRELEKELLLDDDESVSNDTVSVLTVQKPVNIITPSPTTSSSSCASSSSTVSSKQLISEAAEAITDGKTEIAMELVTRLQQYSNARAAPEQRIGYYIAHALLKRVNSTTEERQPSSAMEMYRKDHILSTQLLYNKSPCFKLAFMAANDVIMQTLLDSSRPDGNNNTNNISNIHVVDFDIGHGLQYVYLVHEIAAARRVNRVTNVSLKLTTFRNFGNGGDERLKLVGDGLKSLSKKLGVIFEYNVMDFKLSNISKQGLAVANNDILVVNFAFKLNKLPDESVTVENLRDALLRRVKALSPAAVTIAEQDLNTNTASFAARVNDVFGYYTALVESFDATIPKDNSERVKIEEGLSRRIVNSVACEGRDRVERCEVFGKWRARMGMAGFVPKPLSQLTADSLLLKLNSGTRGNPGFSVKEDLGGISFGWLGRTLTTVSVWC